MQKNSDIDLSPFGIIAAVSLNGVIGVNGNLPWNIPADRRIFEDITRDKILIVGRRTLFEDSSGNFDHISHCRRIYVVSRTLREDQIEYLNLTKSESLPSFHLASSVEEALHRAQTININQISVDSAEDHEMNSPLSSIQCWIGGGEAIYTSALKLRQARFLHLTVVNTSIDIPIMAATKGNVAFFPDRFQWVKNYKVVSKTDHPSCDPTPFTTLLYERITTGEPEEVD